MYEAPKPDEILTIAVADGAKAVVRQYVNDGPIRLLISHGNGFAIDGYRQFWEPLRDTFEVVVFDQRNHGLNPPSDPAQHSYDSCARDIECVVDALAIALTPKQTVGVFHSLSARAAMMQALRSKWLWNALVLFDPPTVAPFDSELRRQSESYGERLAAWAMERPDRFENPAELMRFYAQQAASRDWTTESIEAMAHAVLKKDTHNSQPTAQAKKDTHNKSWHLRCPRELEAQIYRQNPDIRLWPRADQFAGPVLLVGSEAGPGIRNAIGETNRALAEAGGFDYKTLPGAGHMMQVEQPAACADLLRQFLAERA